MKRIKQNQRNQQTDKRPTTIDERTLEGIRGGVNGGLNRDLIRRKYFIDLGD